MLVIPAINCRDRVTALDEIRAADHFFDKYGWIHIDVADGAFTNAITWGSPGEISELTHKFPHINFEVHLMVDKPDEVARQWLKSGAKRIIFHIEALKHPEKIAELCRKYKVEPMLACGPRTPAEWFKKYFGIFDAFQLLAVTPGFAGQEFDNSTLKKIKFLREYRRDVKIEVDGGINPSTARLVKNAGADIVVSASYIFGNELPKIAYGKLTRL